MRTASRPLLVGLPADTREDHGLLFHSLGDKYVRAVVDVARCPAVMLPSIGEQGLDNLLDNLSGIVMTGATSNVHPPRYGAVPTPDHEPYDLGRDDTTLALIGKVLGRGLPLLCICRGFQELNVVLGGTLEAEIQSKAGHLDHRAPESEDLDVRYGPAHPIRMTPGGVLERILGKSQTQVNTVHRQGLGRVALRLTVEATAPDGIVEAVSVTGAAGFTLGIQWHPEYKAAANPDSVKIFEAFGAAVRDYASGRAATGLAATGT